MEWSNATFGLSQCNNLRCSGLKAVHSRLLRCYVSGERQFAATKLFASPES
jgi:hypothetical protein